MKSFRSLTFLLLGLISTFNIYGQNYFTLDPGGWNPLSTLYEDANKKIGLGTVVPEAYFHIKQDFGSTPLFYSESSDYRIKFLYEESSINFGIRQQGQLVNNFEGLLWIGAANGPFTSFSNSDFRSHNLSTYSFIFDNTLTNYNLSFENPSSICSFTMGSGMQTYYPLSINANGIIASQVITSQFQLRNQQAAGRVLVSDINGFGTWTDPSTIIGGGGTADDDWFRSEELDTSEPPDPDPQQLPALYLNPKYGRVGIGTSDPKSKLHIEGNLLFANTKNGTSTCEFGDIYSTDSPLGEWGIQYKMDEINGGGLNFKRMIGVGRPAVDYCLYIRNDGFIGIGTPSPQSLLSVNGKITAQEIEVLATGWVPDYVFDDGYKLKSLKEVEDFIKIHKHLPDVNSAQEIQKEGMNLGEMNNVMLKKIEELTLYVIQLKKEIDTLKNEKSK